MINPVKNFVSVLMLLQGQKALLQRLEDDLNKSSCSTQVGVMKLLSAEGAMRVAFSV